MCAAALFLLYSRALLLRIVCIAGRGRLGCYRSFMPWHPPWLLSLRLIMAPEAFALAFDFSFIRLSDSEPLPAAPAVAAFALDCICSASIQKPCSAFVSCLCSF